MNAILGLKQLQSQRFLENGIRIPVTLVDASGNIISATKTKGHDGYWAVQIGRGFRPTKTKDANGDEKRPEKIQRPHFLREVRLNSEKDLKLFPKIGEKLVLEAVLKPGDIIDVVGVSKGKGFAGGVKRYHFRGGPRTHGQSDRERAPGSVGAGTTPGHVYKGKRMAGKMGNERVTVKNLMVAGIEAETLLIKGLVPGIPGGLLYIRKVGEAKKFVPLIKGTKEAEGANGTQEIKEPKGAAGDSSSDQKKKA